MYRGWEQEFIGLDNGGWLNSRLVLNPSAYKRAYQSTRGDRLTQAMSDIPESHVRHEQPLADVRVIINNPGMQLILGRGYGE